VVTAARDERETTILPTVPPPRVAVSHRRDASRDAPLVPSRKPA
jgi:hypothetical protein